MAKFQLHCHVRSILSATTTNNAHLSLSTPATLTIRDIHPSITRLSSRRIKSPPGRQVHDPDDTGMLKQSFTLCEPDRGANCRFISRFRVLLHPYYVHGLPPTSSPSS